MNARWINAEIATCAIAGRAANRVYGKVTLLLYMIDFQFCRAPIATRRSLKRVNGKAALHKYSNELERAN